MHKKQIGFVRLFDAFISEFTQWPSGIRFGVGQWIVFAMTLRRGRGANPVPCVTDYQPARRARPAGGGGQCSQNWILLSNSGNHRAPQETWWWKWLTLCSFFHGAQNPRTCGKHAAAVRTLTTFQANSNVNSNPTASSLVIFRVKTIFPLCKIS